MRRVRRSAGPRSTCPHGQDRLQGSRGQRHSQALVSAASVRRPLPRGGGLVHPSWCPGTSEPRSFPRPTSGHVAGSRSPKRGHLLWLGIVRAVPWRRLGWALQRGLRCRVAQPRPDPRVRKRAARRPRLRGLSRRARVAPQLPSPKLPRETPAASATLTSVCVYLPAWAFLAVPATMTGT